MSHAAQSFARAEKAIRRFAARKYGVPILIICSPILLVGLVVGVHIYVPICAVELMLQSYLS